MSSSTTLHSSWDGQDQRELRELQRTKARLASTEARLAQRELEVAERDHRIANSLQLVVSLLHLQRKELDPGPAREALEAAGSRIDAIASLHRHLTRNLARPTLELKPLLEGLASGFRSAWGLRCEVDAAPVEVAADTAMNIALVINELAINASKHAYDGEEGGVLHIRCRREARGDLVVCVADEGPGLADDFELDGGGLGMTIVNSLARLLGGRLSVETGAAGGACFTLRTPLGADAQMREGRADVRTRLQLPHTSR